MNVNGFGSRSSSRKKSSLDRSGKESETARSRTTFMSPIEGIFCLSQFYWKPPGACTPVSVKAWKLDPPLQQATSGDKLTRSLSCDWCRPRKPGTVAGIALKSREVSAVAIQRILLRVLGVVRNMRSIESSRKIPHAVRTSVDANCYLAKYREIQTEWRTSWSPLSENPKHFGITH